MSDDSTRPVEQATAAPGEKRVTELPEGKVVRLQPGDTVLITTPHRLSPAEAEQMKRQLEEILPRGVKAAVIANGAEATVVRRDA